MHYKAIAGVMALASLAYYVHQMAKEGQPLRAAVLKDSVKDSSGRHHRHCKRHPGLRLAIYQGGNFHSEIFGTFLAYAAACHHQITLFFDGNGGTNVLPYYETLYAHEGYRGTRKAADFRGSYSAYDAVFFTTSTYASPLDWETHMGHAERFIYILHGPVGDSVEAEYMRLRIGMSPLVLSAPPEPFMLPTYIPPALMGEYKDGPAFLSETAALWAQGKTWSPVSNASAAAPPSQRLSLPTLNTRSLGAKTVIMVGSMDDNSTYSADALLRIAAGIQEAGYSFAFYGRVWHTERHYEVPSNVVLNTLASTDEIIKQAQAATLLLIFPLAGSQHLTDRLTGALPLAISQGIPILTTRAFASIYGLDLEVGALVVDSVDEAIEVVLSLNEESYAALLNGMALMRVNAWVHAVRTIEAMLEAAPANRSSLPP
jgi:hypothetical protein